MPRIQIRLNDDLHKEIEERVEHYKKLGKGYSESNISTIIRGALENQFKKEAEEKDGIFSYPINLNLSEDELRSLKSKLEKEILALDEYKKEESILSAHLMMIYQKVALLLKYLY